MMSHDESPAVDGELETWARCKLGGLEGEPLNQLRARFFQCVADHSFAPPASLTDAWSVLNNGSEDLPGEYLTDLKATSASRVARFAREFFTLDALERELKYQALEQECLSYPALQRRLQELKPGLGVNPQLCCEREPSLVPLVQAIADSFVAPPALRTAIVRNLLEQEQGDPDLWESAALRLKSRYPAIASLQPEIINLLTWRQQLLKRETLLATQTAKPVTLSGLTGAFGFFVAFIVIVMLVARGNLNSPQPGYRPPSGSVTYPHYDWYSSPEATKLEKLRQRYDDDTILGATDTHILSMFSNRMGRRPKTEAELAIDTGYALKEILDLRAEFTGETLSFEQIVDEPLAEPAEAATTAASSPLVYPLAPGGR